MKKIIFSTVLALLVGIIFTQCKKKKGDPDPGIKAPTPLACTNLTGVRDSYLPNTTGTQWVYKGGQNYTSTVSCDTIVGTAIYTKMYNSKSTVPGLFRKDGTTYVSIGSTLLNNFIVLKDEAVNTTWTNNYPNLIGNYDYKYELTIEARDLTKVVNGVTFTNVIKVKQEIFIDLKDGDGFDSEEIDYYYYAKGVGFIYGEFATVADVYLESYSIK